MNPPTRLAFWAASWLLWACSVVYRVGTALERPKDEEDPWWLLGGLLAVLAGYVTLRLVWAVTDTAWEHGFRR